MRDRKPIFGWLLLCVVCVLTGALGALAAFSSAATQKKSPADAGVFAADKGKLTVQLEGHTVGHEEFEISPNGAGWTAKGTTELKAPDSPAAKVSGTLTVQPDGAPISY